MSERRRRLQARLVEFLSHLASNDIASEYDHKDEPQAERTPEDKYGPTRCLLCDWTIGPTFGCSYTFHEDTVFPQRYGNAWIGKDSICSVCKGGIEQSIKLAKKPKWCKKYLTRAEKTTIATLRRQATRNKDTKEEVKGKIKEIEERSEERFYYLYQDKFDGPPNFKLSEGWLDLCDQHMGKTAFQEPQSRTDRELAVDEQLELPASFDQDDVDYDHTYSGGYGYHSLYKPPREDYNDPALYGEGLRGAIEGLADVWKDYLPIWKEQRKWSEEQRLDMRRQELISLLWARSS